MKVSGNKGSVYFAFSLLMMIFTHHSFASSLIATPQNRIELKISKVGINRISLFPYSISQVTGDESLYRLRSDNDGQNIYIMPLGKIGSKIELSLKSNIGYVQDLVLEVAAIPGTSTEIDMRNIKKAGEGLSSDIDLSNIDREAKLMMKAMTGRIQGKYYVRAADRLISNNLGIKIKQIQTYHFKQLTGVILEITNTAKFAAPLEINSLSRLFEHSLAVSIENNISDVLPRSSIKAFVITKDEGKDE